MISTAWFSESNCSMCLNNIWAEFALCRYMKRIILFSLLGLGLIAFAAFTFTYRNVEVSKADCLMTTGIVSNIFEGGVKDVVFELDGKKQSFYINSGVENGFDINVLEKQLLAQDVLIYYADAWSPFAPLGTKSKHIREIRSGNWIVYSEF